MNLENMQRMKAAGIRPSYVRMKILSYIRSASNHPTADMIYKVLAEEIPTLSRTSVYNTLCVLEGAQLLRNVSIDGEGMRFDAFMPDHGHFRCTKCGNIFDLEIDVKSAEVKIPSGFTETRRDLFVYGICPHCSGFDESTKK
ncbi:MAG: transcriptional repressor [Christensenellaceae bacterium]|nr:transcriptional repressor [Christensenellaceae bacterium]